MKNITRGTTHWCFALVNNRLAEIYFNKTKNGKPKIWGHCYIRKNEFATQHEQRQIATDIKKAKLVYRNKKYHDKNKSKTQPSAYGL